jgi:hypothetical protein
MNRVMTICLLGIVFLSVGCASNLTRDARFQIQDLAKGDVFELKEDAFFHVYPDGPFRHRSIRPQTEYPFSVEQYQDDPTVLPSDSARYIAGVVKAGTRIRFTKIEGSSNWSTGLQPVYYGEIISGPLKSGRKIHIGGLLFVGGTDKGLSQKYLKKVKEDS